MDVQEVVPLKVYYIFESNAYNLSQREECFDRALTVSPFSFKRLLSA